MSWANISAPRAPQIGAGFTEEQRATLVEAMTGAVILGHPQSSHSWVVRVNAAGNLEFLATQGDARYDVVAVVTRAGAFTAAAAVAGGAGLAEPGR